MESEHSSIPENDRLYMGMSMQNQPFHGASTQVIQSPAFNRILSEALQTQE
jgi:hypothetical protein